MTMAELVGDFGGYVNYSEDWRANEAAQTERVQAEVRAEAPGDLVGEIVKWPRADGYATYMISSQEPLQLLHCNFGDAYSIEPALIRGLIVEDLEPMVARERSLRELFARKAS